MSFWSVGRTEIAASLARRAAKWLTLARGSGGRVCVPTHDTRVACVSQHQARPVHYDRNTRDGIHTATLGLERDAPMPRTPNH
eukprot:7131994-Alexandrium_andersonii.AAC.1